MRSSLEWAAALLGGISLFAGAVSTLAGRTVMKSGGRRRTAHPGLVLWVTCLCGCAAGMGGSRQGTEGIVVPFLSGNGVVSWNIGHSAEDQRQRVTEFVRSGETVENWTELVTSQTLNKAFELGSVGDQMAAHEGDLGARCPGSTVQVLRHLPNGVVYESQVVNCPQGADEHVLARVLDGASNRFLVQYSVRGAVTIDT